MNEWISLRNTKKKKKKNNDDEDLIEASAKPCMTIQNSEFFKLINTVSYSKPLCSAI